MLEALRKMPTAQRRFVLLHPGSGTLFCYRVLVQLLPDSDDVVGILSPNVDLRRPFRHRSVAGLAIAYNRILAALSPVSQTHIIGWSFGGVVGFELCRRHRGTAGERHLCLIDAHVVGSYLAAIDPEDTVGFFWGVLNGDLTTRCPDAVRQAAAGRNENRLLETVFTHHAGRFDAASFRMARRLFQIHRNHFQSLERYRPSGPAHSVRRISLHRARRSASQRDDPMMGWGNVMSPKWSHHDYAADHQSILDSPMLRRVLDNHLSPPAAGQGLPTETTSSQ